LTNIVRNSDANLNVSFTSLSSSSLLTSSLLERNYTKRFASSTQTTPEKMIAMLQYLKIPTQTRNADYRNNKEYVALAETTTYEVIFVAIYLGMTEDVFNNNILQQTQIFLEGIHFWKWNDIVLSLISCLLFYEYAYCYGLLEKIISAVLTNIVRNSDANLNVSFTSLSSSSLLTPSLLERNYTKRFASSTQTTSEKSNLTSKSCWFKDLETLLLKVVEKLFQCIESYKDDSNMIAMLQYLKIPTQTRNTDYINNKEYAALAETTTYEVIFV
ncbi:hypothetical protein RYX36_031001, partial [Vicia faba]